MLEILVVVNDGVDRLGIAQALDDAGHCVYSASTFFEAKRLLAEVSPDLVIADQRLGAYNGLHVLLRARCENPHVGTIVTSTVRERGLEAEAKRLDVECVIKPQDPTEWPVIVSKVLDVDCAFRVAHYHGGSSSHHSFIQAPTT